MQSSDFRYNDKRFYLFLLLNVAVVILVFLAFVFSAVSFASGKSLSDEVRLNNTYAAPGALVSKQYEVAKDFYVTESSVVSFCAQANEICEGLGPAWLKPFRGSDSSQGAAYGVLTQLTPQIAIYAHVPAADWSSLLISVIDTSTFTSVARQTTTYKLDDNYSFYHLRMVTTSDPNIVAILYTSHNTTYLMVGTLNSAFTQINLSPPVEVFSIDVFNQTRPLRSDIAHVGLWTLVTWGFDTQESNYRAYELDSSTSKLKSVLDSSSNVGLLLTVYELLTTFYIGAGRILQANANSYAYGQVDFDQKTITFLAKADLRHHFDTLHITSLYDNWIVFSGVQYLYVDVPLTVAFTVAISTATPYLHDLGWPTNIFTTSNIVPWRNQISVAYVPPHEKEPYGGLFYTYVDARSRRAKVVRARPVNIRGNIQIASSPSFDISSYEYGSYSAPLISGPTANNLTLVVVQDQGTVYNTFFWSGGYQYAGIVQKNATAGQKVTVVRDGISSGHKGLIPGTRYYATNYGHLTPYTLVMDSFTHNANRWHIGTAINDNQLLINPGAFENYGY